MNQTAETRVVRARTRLLLDSPWFGALSMRLRTIETSDVPTMATNGTYLKFNPEFVDSVTDQELTGVMAHEVMHCALLHPYRIGARDLKTWNQATDYAINEILVNQGFKLPEGALLDAQFSGMGADQIYAILSRQPKDDSPNQPGEIEQPGSGEEAEGSEGAPQGMTETDWQIATEQATAIASKAGNLPGSAAREAKAAREPMVDWREVLRRFIEQTVPSDYSWTSPNRRHVANGLYLPGMVRENMPRLAIGIDTSGSISDASLQLFAAELTSIMHETRPEAIDVYYCDHEVNKVETFSPDDPEVKLSACGGGGTLFQPVLDRIQDSGEIPAALVYFTDLEGEMPREPEYPVLWITEQTSRLVAPFGETVRIPA